ncbi:hypothetical protein NLG97_g1765 [Lecanicillium saksenae]|uniref:Uncharacterized protein n=1 Tax=Lecanicillium saksenae TaxID=468837 RepID=A0ACC1R3H3_9HYPO|nr:hypothetical protein NLG97_g1765 [Lecanicillium saksenae]
MTHPARGHTGNDRLPSATSLSSPCQPRLSLTLGADTRQPSCPSKGSSLLSFAFDATTNPGKTLKPTRQESDKTHNSILSRQQKKKEKNRARDSWYPAPAHGCPPPKRRTASHTSHHTPPTPHTSPGLPITPLSLSLRLLSPSSITMQSLFSVTNNVSLISITVTPGTFLAVVDNRLLGLGWFLVPVMVLGCALMITVALIINNLERRFPVYWWTPEALHAKKPILHRAKDEDVESAPASTETTKEEKPESADDAAAATADVSHRKHELNEVIIRPGDVLVPHDMYLTQEEVQLLETLSRRL